MEASGRFVHDVDVAAPRQFGGELEALRFAAREGRQRLAEAQIADAHIDQDLQAAPDASASFPRTLDRREEAEGVGDGHLQHVMDGAAVVGQLQDVVPVPPALADLAVQTHVVEERQLDFQETRPLHSGQEPLALKLKSAGETWFAAANALRMGSNTPT